MFVSLFLLLLRLDIGSASSAPSAYQAPHATSQVDPRVVSALSGTEFYLLRKANDTVKEPTPTSRCDPVVDNPMKGFEVSKVVEGNTPDLHLATHLIEKYLPNLKNLSSSGLNLVSPRSPHITEDTVTIYGSTNQSIEYSPLISVTPLPSASAAAIAANRGITESAAVTFSRERGGAGAQANLPDAPNTKPVTVSSSPTAPTDRKSLIVHVKDETSTSTTTATVVPMRSTSKSASVPPCKPASDPTCNPAPDLTCKPREPVCTGFSDLTPFEVGQHSISTEYIKELTEGPMPQDAVGQTINITEHREYRDFTISSTRELRRYLTPAPVQLLQNSTQTPAGLEGQANIIDASWFPPAKPQGHASRQSKRSVGLRRSRSINQVQTQTLTHGDSHHRLPRKRVSFNDWMPGVDQPSSTPKPEKTKWIQRQKYSSSASACLINDDQLTTEEPDLSGSSSSVSIPIELKMSVSRGSGDLGVQSSDYHLCQDIITKAQGLQQSWLASPLASATEYIVDDMQPIIMMGRSQRQNSSTSKRQFAKYTRGRPPSDPRRLRENPPIQSRSSSLPWSSRSRSKIYVYKKKRRRTTLVVTKTGLKDTMPVTLSHRPNRRGFVDGFVPLDEVRDLSGFYLDCTLKPMSEFYS